MNISGGLYREASNIMRKERNEALLSKGEVLKGKVFSKQFLKPIWKGGKFSFQRFIKRPIVYTVENYLPKKRVHSKSLIYTKNLWKLMEKNFIV